MRDDFKKTSEVFSFAHHLMKCFGYETARDVISLMEKLQLPMPLQRDQFLADLGHLSNKDDAHALLFSNKYGIVVRIESEKLLHVNDNPLILQPLGSFKVGKAVVEICPGIHSSDNQNETAFIGRTLAQHGGLEFTDANGTHNIGRLPVVTVRFPNGVPVILDRPSVVRLPGKTEDKQKILEEIGAAEDPQRIYQPLREALADAATPQKVTEFWLRCVQFVADGKLVPGWNEKRRDQYKLHEARKHAKKYDLRMVHERRSP